MGRAPCCDKANVKRGPWSPEEDAKLKSYIEQHGTGGNWIALPQKIGLKRCGKSCRLRWLNYLRPNIKHGGFSEEEDNIICSLYVTIGSRWSVIAAQLPGRTDNDIKNYWNTRLKKKLLGKHRKDQQARRGRSSSSVTVSDNKNGNIIGDSSLFVPQSNYPQPQAPPHSYWPHMPTVSQPLPYSELDQQDSIRNLLIKLGGRFSDDFVYHDGFKFQFPSDDGTTTSTQPVYELASAASVNDAVNNNEAVQLGQSQCYCSGLDLMHGGSLIDQEMWASDDAATLDGLGYLDGEHMNMMMNDNKITGPIPTPTSSRDTYSMVYHPLVDSDRECMPQQFHFQELGYPGAH